MGIILEALNELKKCDTALKEDLEHWFKKNYAGIFGDIPEKEINKRIVEISKIDPTIPEHKSDKDILSSQQGPYVQWLLNLIKKNRISYENLVADKQEFIDQLKVFNDLKGRKKLPADKRDIMTYKSLSELMDVIASLGADLDISEESNDTFQSIVKNIRAALISVCGFKDNEIPSEIQRTEDCLTLIGENGKWEIWLINSIWGAMLADTYGIDWGAGATWCTGGQYGFYGQPRKGAELLRSAQTHYPHYTSDGRHLVFFSQKDNSVRRPQNKAQITFDKDFYACKDFFHANDRPISLTSTGELNYTGDYTHGVTSSEILSAFISEEQLTDVIKGSILKNCESIKDVENREKLEKGEPYEYVGGKIKDVFKSAIKIITYADSNGEIHMVDATEHKEYLECESVNEMENMDNLILGKPYIYDGSYARGYIPVKFRKLIKEVIVPDSYDKTVLWTTGENMIGIGYNAFIGCENMTKCTFPAQVALLATGAFRVNGFDAPYTDIELYTPRHKIHCSGGDDAEFLQKHLHYIGESNNSGKTVEPEESEENSKKAEEK